ncbi:hypothetical protein [Streptomyces auratus]|uniref:Integral membrane protein n=1 Tax=Streptomyces auratus AGR0001 TaxID=1160718 RepID=A0A8B1P2I5_9ACTN|nr:hypothetical protein [Streptomyces auratus]QTZ92921.1 hypothetical protein SU9_016745 [Streptomyces auratus AGR0001]
MQQASLLSAMSGLEPRARAVRSGPARDLWWLAAVAVVFTACLLCSALATPGLGWDEAVYVSQVDPHRPAAFFSAPRARGVSFLLAPAAALTTSAPVLHCYLAVLSGAGLLLSLCVWRRLLPAPVPALGGALFAGLWVTLFYGPQAMPNLWVAYAALAATGCFLRAVRKPSRQLAPRAGRGAAVGMAAAVALAALMRPTDAVWLVVPLFAAALCVPTWRRPAVLVGLLAGLALGCAEWVAEAYLSYGGLLARLRQAARIQGGLGWHLSFDDHARALQGKTLCRPCHLAWDHPEAAVWWFVLPLAVIGAVWAALRARDSGGALLGYGPVWPAARRDDRHPLGLAPVPPAGLRGPTVPADGSGSAEALYRCRPAWAGVRLRDSAGPVHRYGPAPLVMAALAGLCLAAPYLLTVDYAAPRFLLPAYALLLMPAAWFLYWLTRLPRRGQAWAVAALVLVLLGHEAVQLVIVHKMVQSTARAQTGIGRIAGMLRAAGVRPPCVVSGEEAVRVAYQVGCASRQPYGHDAGISPAALARLGAHRPAAVLVRTGDRPPAYARGWRPLPLRRVPGVEPLSVYVSPPTRP